MPHDCTQLCEGCEPSVLGFTPRLNRTSCCRRKGIEPFPVPIVSLTRLVWDISPACQLSATGVTTGLDEYHSIVRGYSRNTSKPRQHKLVPTVLYDTVSLGLRRLQLAPVLAHLCRGCFRRRHLLTEGVGLWILLSCVSRSLGHPL